MKCFVFFDLLKNEYIVPADTLEEAKTVMRKHYTGPVLEIILTMAPEIRELPEMFVSLDPRNLLWKEKNK